MNYVICEMEDGGYTAGSKARDDISTVVSGMDGWASLSIKRRWSTYGVADKLRAFATVTNDWTRVFRTLSHGDVLLIQFPVSVGPKLAEIPAWFIKRMRKLGVKIIFLIHDVEYLRGMDFAWERRTLSCADVMIVHNESMKTALEKYYDIPMTSLEIFDYLSDGEWSACEEGIDVAGNLDSKKAGYVYQLASEDYGVDINLFGPNFVGDLSGRAIYHGQFPPEKLPVHLKGKYGLVWDGPSIDTCAGSYGEYLKVNNPHKLSLYLSLGKPVIIWDEAAEASFVEQHGVGIAASSIPEALERCRSIAYDDYLCMRHAAEAVGRQLRSGAYTRRAISSALKALNSLGNR